MQTLAKAPWEDTVELQTPTHQSPGRDTTRAVAFVEVDPATNKVLLLLDTCQVTFVLTFCSVFHRYSFPSRLSFHTNIMIKVLGLALIE